MDISIICEKARTGTLNSSRATAAAIMDKEYFVFMVRSPFIVVTVAF